MGAAERVFPPLSESVRACLPTLVVGALAQEVGAGGTAESSADGK